VRSMVSQQDRSLTAKRSGAGGKWIGELARLVVMGHEQDAFADFYRSSRDSCLKAVTAVVGDLQLAEDMDRCISSALSRIARRSWV
jgi:hypothetical protein